MLRYASVSTASDHNLQCPVLCCQVQAEDPAPMVLTAIRLYSALQIQPVKLSLDLFLLTILPFHQSEDCQTSASWLRYDTMAEYTKTHRLLSDRDDSVLLLPHASTIHDYAGLPSEILLFRMKNK